MFKKTCPYCGKLIDVGKLHKVPRAGKLHWYQITPAPHTACPDCGGFVISTVNNSPVIVLIVGVPLILIISSIFITEIKEALEILPGGITFLVVIVIPFAIWIGKRAKLVKDTS